MLFDVEEGNNLILTRLTPVATLIDTKKQSASTSFKRANGNVFVTFVQGQILLMRGPRLIHF